jgi:putative hemolysin
MHRFFIKGDVKMKPNKSIFSLVLLVTMLIGAACNGAPEAEDEVIGMANPASVFCEENGGTLEIRTQKDGGQYGVCIFEDGSECDEWAFYQEHCKPGDIFPADEASMPIPQAEEPGTLEGQPVTVAALYGSVISPSQKGPSDNLLFLASEGLPVIYITGETAEIEEQIQEMKDKSEPANKANFWGVLDCTSPDECLLTVSRMRKDGPGEEVPSDLIKGWEGVIYSGPPGPRSGGDDYFALLGDLPLQYGIDSLDESIRQQLEELRDSGQAVRIWGELHAGRMDWNATQIVVTEVELIEVDSSQIPPAPSW